MNFLLFQYYTFVLCVTGLSNFVSSNYEIKIDRQDNIDKSIYKRPERDSGIHIKECAYNEFQCDYESCVKLSATCNGIRDCANGADETAQLCSRIPCKNNEFRCEYGACVKKESLCDGDWQCIDGSDEDWHICQNFTCPINKFRCEQGICKDRESICDGICTCPSCVDESKELCEKNSCPKNKFRCDYGACLDKNQLCDGVENCKNGADENEHLCGNRTCPENRFRCDNGICIHPSLVCDGECYCNGCLDERVAGCGYKNYDYRHSCIVPAITADRTYTLQCPSEPCEKRPGKWINNSSHILVKCSEGYYSENGNQLESICIKREWIPPVPVCQKICEPLKPVNEELICSLNRSSTPVSCAIPLIYKSVVHIKCKEGYRPPGVEKLGVSLTCGKDGKWNDKFYTCEPDCGKSFRNSQSVNNHGKAEIVGDSPWHMAIYSTATSKHPVFICGATIISEYLIVSAAHCFRESDDTPYSEEHFEAIVAKVEKDYNSSESNKMKKYKIKTIHFPPDDFLNRKYKTYLGDIALLETTTKIEFNKMVVPACLDWLAVEPFQSDQTFNGKLVGWGDNGSRKPNYVLQAAVMPFVDKQRCLDLVNAEFKREKIKADTFCAGNRKDADTLPGDSGGGLLFRDVHSDSYFIRGIMSSKYASNPSLITFTDISLYLDWIDSVKTQIYNEHRA